MSGIADTLIAFVHANQNWAAPIILLLAFCESFAFISLLVPAIVVILAISGLLGAAQVEFWPVYVSAVAGAFLGDWLAFEAALHFRTAIGAVWPLSKHPELLRRGFDLFGRWGIIMVFIGRFFGPLRAVVPIAAGVAGMSRIKFQLANFASAIAWAAAILTPGALGIPWLLS
jgi:membrane protein DedA with SNARE-associated domain